MLIRDAILELHNEHEIFFLLTAYVEARGFCDKLSMLPWQARDLPLAGADDIQARIDGLRLQLGGMASDADRRARLIIEETIDIFNAALHRLAFLQAGGGLSRAACPRSDHRNPMNEVSARSAPMSGGSRLSPYGRTRSVWPKPFE
jgi:hypothetical protein